jgi:hypothetical protein
LANACTGRKPHDESFIAGGADSFDPYLLQGFSAEEAGSCSFCTICQALNASPSIDRVPLDVTTLNPRIETIHGVAKSKS